MNNVALVGRLTKDPDLRFTPSGVAVANFTIAVNRRFKQEGQPEADFINCVVWKKPAENLANYQKKGSLIGIEGSIQTRSFDGQDGKKVYVTEVLANNIEYLEPRDATRTQSTYSEDEPKKNNFTGDNDPFGSNNKTIDISSDDLPF